MKTVKIHYKTIKDEYGWLNMAKVRRHSKRHIIKLYNKLENGDTCSTTRRWWDEGESFSTHHNLRKGTITLTGGDYRGGGYIFTYKDLRSFTMLFRTVCDLQSPTWYIKIMRGEV